MYAILYMSEARAWIAPDEMERLCMRWGALNAAVDVTGLLLFDGRRYMQLIEGPDAAARALMTVIAGDPRHANIAYLIDGPAPARQFAGWALRQQRLDAEEPSLRDGAMTFIRQAADPRVQAALMGFTAGR